VSAAHIKPDRRARKRLAERSIHLKVRLYEFKYGEMPPINDGYRTAEEAPEVLSGGSLTGDSVAMRQTPSEVISRGTGA
jgi:hypothetical protein